MKIGEVYKSKEYGWKIKILALGEKKAFAVKLLENLESSWDYVFIEKNMELFNE